MFLLQAPKQDLENKQTHLYRGNIFSGEVININVKSQNNL